jgi:DNA-binding MarR family transcriptional regulator
MTDDTRRPPKRRRAETFAGLGEQLSHGAAAGPLKQSELAGSLGFLLRLANGVALGKLAERLEAVGLRQSTYSVMLIVHENPGLKQHEVGEALSIQQPNLVALVSELVSAGLIARLPCEEDRRANILALTEQGEAVLARAREAHAENEAALESALSPIPADAFRETLQRILRMA